MTNPPTTRPLSEPAREILYNELCESMIEGLKASTLQYEAAQDSAGFIVEKLDAIKTYPELVVFLGELAAKWPAYMPVYHLVKEVESRVKDETMMNKITAELKAYHK